MFPQVWLRALLLLVNRRYTVHKRYSPSLVSQAIHCSVLDGVIFDPTFEPAETCRLRFGSHLILGRVAPKSGWPSSSRAMLWGGVPALQRSPKQQNTCCILHIHFLSKRKYSKFFVISKILTSNCNFIPCYFAVTVTDCNYIFLYSLLSNIFDGLISFFLCTVGEKLWIIKKTDSKSSNKYLCHMRAAAVLSCPLAAALLRGTQLVCPPSALGRYDGQVCCLFIAAAKRKRQI